jgi:NAD(P)H-hydrate epimerase
MDRQCARRFGISTIVLMENAAVHVCAAALLVAPVDKRPRVLVVTGTGNNGGDALATARHLSNAGATVSILLVGDAKKLSPDAATQLKTCQSMRLPITIAKSSLKASLPAALRQLGRGWPDVVVDGLFGTGLSREATGVALETIQVMNGLRAKGARVVAIDIPSGLDASSGKPLGGAVYADMTVTFVGLKTGMLTPEASRYLGRVAIADIGVPRSLIESLGKRLGSKARMMRGGRI